MKLLGKWLLIGMVTLVGVTALRIATSATPRATSSERMAQVGQDTQVFVSKQDSDGVSNDQINIEVAQRIGEYSLERMRHHTDRILGEMRSSENSDALTQQSVLVPNNGVNLIVTRIYVANRNFAVQVSGIKGSELTRVICMAPRGDQDVLLPGKCAEELETQFAFSLSGGA